MRTLLSSYNKFGLFKSTITNSNQELKQDNAILKQAMDNLVNLGSNALHFLNENKNLFFMAAFSSLVNSAIAGGVEVGVGGAINTGLASGSGGVSIKIGW